MSNPERRVVKPTNPSLLPRDYRFGDVIVNSVRERSHRAVFGLTPRDPAEVLCMDGRLRPRTPNGHAIRTAGPVGLHGKRKELAALTTLKESGFVIAGVTTHQDCGAASLKALETGEDPLKVAQRASEGLAADLGVPHLGHRSLDRGKVGNHPEQTIVVLGEGVVDPSTMGFPPSFVISGHLGPELTASNVALAEEIARGQHGLGNKITQENPLHRVVVARTESEAATLAEMLPPLTDEKVQTHVLYFPKGRIL